MLKRSKEDLWKAFEVQQQALKISLAAFDMGFLGEATRLASSTFALAGQRMKSHKSILDQLCMKTRLNFITGIPEGSVSGTPLIACDLTVLSNNKVLVEIVPLRRSMNKRVLPFGKWWNKVVLKTDDRELSREQVVRILRDKDGGAHFQEEIRDPLVADALRGKITGFLMKNDDGTTTPEPHSMHFTMRQIAEELESTIRHAPLIFG